MYPCQLRRFRLCKMQILKVFATCAFGTICCTASQQTIQDVEKYFRKYDTIEAPIFLTNSKERNRVKRSSTSIADFPNEKEITLKFQNHNNTFIVDLSLNKQLFSSSYFEKLDSENGFFVNNTKLENFKQCHYKGKLRGSTKSWAAVSTCDNQISVVIFDGKKTLFVEPVVSASGNKSQYYFMTSQDLKNVTGRCDVQEEQNRVKRETNMKMPAGSNSRSRFVELLLVVDRLQFEKLDENVKTALNRYKQLSNIINTLYEPLNIYIALVGIVIWDKRNKIKVSSSGEATLKQFLKYRWKNLLNDYPNDNAQLLTGATFSNSIVGKASKNSICTAKYSGGVNMDHGVIGLVAATVAHEMGHNFGLDHDRKNCFCSAEKCIMSTMSSMKIPSTWSSCSQSHLLKIDKMKLDFCLYNKPKFLLGPVCGNGFVEDGEECDCGENKHCKCCNVKICKLFSNATCATGTCCDLSTCKVEHVGHICRPSIGECDLPEYCDGATEYCPENYFVADGTECKEMQSYCAGGQCPTHDDICYELWGNVGTKADDKCFDNNMRGDIYGNCGSEKHSGALHAFNKCNISNVKCGLMQCISTKGQLKFSGKVTKHMASITIHNNRGEKLKCRSVIMDVGPGTPDPGMAPDGIKCSENKVCLNNKCVLVSTIKEECPFNCSNAGICNNQGNCHCDVGFNPPYCDTFGPGGSINSGPASNPTEEILKIFYIFFFGCLPIILLIFFMVLCRKKLVILKIKYFPQQKNENSKALPKTLPEVRPSKRPPPPPPPPRPKNNPSIWKGAKEDQHNVCSERPVRNGHDQFLNV